jgi:hypothetical protein
MRRGKAACWEVLLTSERSVQFFFRVFRGKLFQLSPAPLQNPHQNERRQRQPQDHATNDLESHNPLPASVVSTYTYSW